MEDQIALAKELGLVTAATEATKTLARARKLHKAYQGYKFLRQEHIDAFNVKLKAKSVKTTGKKGVDLREHFDSLVLEPLATYKTLPPKDVLGKLKAAKAEGVFDTFEIASIQSVIEYHDPILFGRIEGCGDRFFVAQWGTDVTVEEILEASGT